ncbi:MAG: type II toxin-antitoxin system Phd/YefM family antitoxin [Roseiarcus sp.]|jgi:prevent-host-death family protein
MEWQLQDAKNQFSKVVQRARTEGPQIVTLRGQRAAIVLSAQDYDALTANRPNIVEHLLSGPEWDDELARTIASRAKTPSRDVGF